MDLNDNDNNYSSIDNDGNMKNIALNFIFQGSVVQDNLKTNKTN